LHPSLHRDKPTGDADRVPDPLQIADVTRQGRFGSTAEPVRIHQAFARKRPDVLLLRFT
jgi:hypothetical protein